MAAPDPAWDMPQINWVQQGVFESGSIPPVSEPTAGTQVWLGPVNQDWLPWICGCLDAGRNPSSWIVADDAHMYDTLRRWDTLMGLICANGGSQMPIMIRYTSDCHLQTSSDGGVTWTDVPGWLDNIGFCIRDALPPPPPQIGPGPIQQYACNLSGFLAKELVEAALAKAVAEYGASVTYVDFALWVGQNTFAAALPYAYLFAQGVFDAWKALTAGNIADFRAAITDPVLISKLTCAIYNAIKNDGKVTDANWPSAVANICAVSYVPADIIPVICAMATTIGTNNIRGLQNTGAYETIDCSGCGDWCWEWDFTASNGGWTVYSDAHGSWSAGNGWVAVYNAGDNTTSINIHVNLPSAQTITRVHVQLKTTVANIVGDFIWELFSGGAFVTDCSWNATADGAIQQYDCGPFSATGDNIYMAFEASGNVAPATLLAVVINGHGINPFGADNCTPG